MSDGVSIPKIAARLCVVLACAALLSSRDCAAQGALPRVGTIKGYPETTGLAAGCGNYYFHKPSYRPEEAGQSLVFISNSDGTYAWLNLNGRDVRLTPIRLSRRDRRRSRGFYYRHGTIRVSVLFEKLAPGERPDDEEGTMKIRITLRRGRAVRTAVGYGQADC